MKTAPVRQDAPQVPLGRLGAAPLDELTAADYSPVVRRVVATHQDQNKIPAARFSSFI